MSDLACNGHRVLGGTLTLPRRGVWDAALELDTDEDVTGAVTIEAADGLTLRGTVRRGGPFEARTTVRVVGGAGGFPTILPPKFYRDTPLRIPVTDLLREAGETLSPTADAALLGQTAAAWAREQGPAADVLAHMLDALGAVWRVLPDGTVWIGTETWPAVDAEHDLLAESTVDDHATIATDAIPADLLPGTTFRDRRVSMVEHRLGPSALRTTVTFETAEAPSPDGPMLGALREIVRSETHRTLYYGLFPARVVRQTADGNLEVQPDDANIPPMTGVPIRTPFPLAIVKVATGSRVLVGFEAGDPRRPYASLWSDGGGLDEMTIIATLLKLGGTGANKALVLDGDGATITNEWKTWLEGVAGAASYPTPAPLTFPVVTSNASATRVRGM